MRKLSLLCLLCSLVAVTALGKDYQLSIQTNPVGVTVYKDGALVSTSTPAQITVSDRDANRTMFFQFSKEGYESANVTVSFTKKQLQAQPVVYCHLNKAVQSAPVQSATVQSAPVPTAVTENVTPVEKPQEIIPAVDNRATVIVPPAQVNDLVDIGYFGSYVADMLMEQLLLCPNVRIVDRELLQTQLNEVDLTGQYIDPATAIERGKILGARYAVQVTMQKPDVTNVRTGVPLASIMGAMQMGLNRNIGAQYMSNMEVARLKAAVTLTARVVDLQTGEIMFSVRGSGQAEGDKQIGLEYGALGGAQLNGGAAGFTQTVTGMATQKAYLEVGRALNDYFSGKSTERVVGAATGYDRFDGKIERRGMSLYKGIHKLNKNDIASMTYADPQLYFKYNSTKRQYSWGCFMMVTGGLATICGIITCKECIGQDDVGEILGPVVTGAGVALLVPGTIMTISARHKMESIKNELNTITQPRYGRVDRGYSLDLVAASGGGLGLRLTF